MAINSPKSNILLGYQVLWFNCTLPWLFFSFVPIFAFIRKVTFVQKRQCINYEQSYDGEDAKVTQLHAVWKVAKKKRAWRLKSHSESLLYKVIA